MKLLFAVISISFFSMSFYTEEYLSAYISNGLIKAKLHLPDVNKGYYQGTRFDWAGVMPELTYKGHSFFGIWNPKFEYGLHDAITGPVEAFMPIGYDKTDIGGTFLQLGVGMLTRPDNKPYAFTTKFQIANRGEWKVKTMKNKVTFTHNLITTNGYAYEYTKTISLSKGKPEMVISHSLKNLGTTTIETSQYNHNFFMIDNELTNENIKTTFPFKVKAEGLNFGNIAEVKDNSIIYKRQLVEKENVFSKELTGFGNTSSDYNITIENLKSGAGVNITADRPIEKIVFWACRTTSCPEPYLRIKVEPGETQNWNLYYLFKVKD